MVKTTKRPKLPRKVTKTLQLLSSQTLWPLPQPPNPGDDNDGDVMNKVARQCKNNQLHLFDVESVRDCKTSRSRHMSWSWLCSTDQPFGRKLGFMVSRKCCRHKRSKVTSPPSVCSITCRTTNSPASSNPSRFNLHRHTLYTYRKIITQQCCFSSFWSRAVD